MLSDTITDIQDQFIERLRAAQEPTLEAVRKASELAGRLPLADRRPFVLTNGLVFTQRLVEAQAEFIAELARAAAPQSASTS